MQEPLNKLSVGAVPKSVWVTLEDDLVDCVKPGCSFFNSFYNIVIFIKFNASFFPLLILQEMMFLFGETTISCFICYFMRTCVLHWYSHTFSGQVKRRWEPLVKDQRSVIELVVKGNYVSVTNETSVQNADSIINQTLSDSYELFWKNYANAPLLGRNLILSSFCPEVFMFLFYC